MISLLLTTWRYCDIRTCWTLPAFGQFLQTSAGEGRAAESSDETSGRRLGRDEYDIAARPDGYAARSPTLAAY